MPAPAIIPALKKIASVASAAGSAISAAGNVAGAFEGATGGKKQGSIAGVGTAATAGSRKAKDTKEDMQTRKEEKDEFKEKVRSHLDAGETLSDEDLKSLVSSAGLPSGVPVDWDRCCERVDLNSGNVWVDVNGQVLDQLAEHCFNHLYTYKEEALELDPSIDTETPQLGPTAQEIEKVNPAAVTEVDGAKFVDTEKLTMTLAGALGELARRMHRIERDLERDKETDKGKIFLGTWGPDARGSSGNGMVNV